MFAKKRNNQLLLLLILLSACKNEPVTPPENQPPDPFSVSVQVDTITALVSWTAADDPDGDPVSYRVELDNQVIVASTQELSHTLPQLDYDRKYSGKIVAFDPEGAERAVSYDITTDPEPNSPPGDITLVSPKDDLLNLDPGNIYFDWETVSDPDGDMLTYELWAGTEGTAADLIHSGTTTNYTATDLLPGETYTWKLIAVDGKGGQSESETREFTTRIVVDATLLTEAPWAARSEHSTLVFNNKIWVLGGNISSGSNDHDVWSSPDGITWTEATSQAGWAKRQRQGAVSFQGKMWIVGGLQYYGAGGAFNDVWSSSDGITWTQEVAQAPFAKRFAFEMAVFNGKMWLFGGIGDDNTYYQDIWSSSDGVSWTEEVNDCGFTLTDAGEVLVYQNKLWVIGGVNDNVYESSDGQNWLQITNDADFGKKIAHACVTHAGRMWLISG
ncbi:MAG: fibronectin type III domain-containing protein, partial [Bacteroidota bacterium]